MFSFLLGIYQKRDFWVLLQLLEEPPESFSKQLHHLAPPRLQQRGRDPVSPRHGHALLQCIILIAALLLK